MELIYPNRPLNWHDVIFQLQQALTKVPDVYIVGGTVRDVYRDRPFKDIDLTCAGDGQPLARRIANFFKGDYYPLDAERGVGRAIIHFQDERWIVDVAAFRGDSLLADLRDRDFTLNAMAVPLQGDLEGIYDPLDGIGDIHKKILRRCSPTSISDDPIRALRAVRQSITLGLMIDPETRRDIKTDGVYLMESSPERVRDEFFALLNGIKPQTALAALDALGLLNVILPEVESIRGIPQTPQMDRWRYTQSVIDQLHVLLTVISPRRDDNVAANAAFGTFVYLMDRFRGFLRAHVEQKWANERTHQMLLVFTTLMLYLAENVDQATERALALRLSSHEIKRIEELFKVARLPLELHQAAPLTARQVYRFWRTTREAGIDACLLALADYLATNHNDMRVPQWTWFLQTIAQLLDGYSGAMNLKPLLSGNDIMAEFNLQPGRQIGELLEALREAQALNEITSFEEGLTFAKGWLLNGHKH